MFSLDLAEKLLLFKKNIKQSKPLVHCLTNSITINDTANILLAVGARPIMADHPLEVAEIVHSAQALVINIGNITDTRIESIFIAGKVAKTQGIPIVFDPVGVACSELRRNLAEQIIRELKPEIIKGNMSEIKCLAAATKKISGVDVAPADVTTVNSLAINLAICRGLATKHNCVVIATGAYDLVTDATDEIVLANGSELLEAITGTGCMCAGLLGAYASSKQYLLASVFSISLMNIAAELAEQDILSQGLGIGSFKIKLFDYLYQLEAETICERGEEKCLS